MGAAFIARQGSDDRLGQLVVRPLQDRDQGFNWGTFLFPGNTLHAGSAGNLWVVPENSKAKSLAYDFIDITMRPEIQNLLGNNGGVPVAGRPVGDHRPEGPAS